VLLLAFDTATPAVTAALHDGSRVIAEESAVDARRHGELLAVSIEKVLRSAGARQRDLTAIAVGTGPGPYTGLRAGLVTAAVLASSLAIPSDGICSLDVIAAAAASGREFLVATDARRREVYWARYDGNGARLDGPRVGKPAELPAELPIAGEGPALYAELSGRALPPRYPSAATLAALAAGRLAAGEPPARPEPLYLRRPDAREPGPPKRVTEPRPVSRRRAGDTA
jgi:tRNA threonylcarbamoyl adenosine modification protein YeaZ